MCEFIVLHFQYKSEPKHLKQISGHTTVELLSERQNNIKYLSDEFTVNMS